jgi:aminoglycoside phosphotransferase (APT) family kinase protein
MPPLDARELALYLERHALVEDLAQAEIRPLDGGVSSSIYVVKTPSRCFVVKQALEKLRVEDDWRCDTGRSLYEQDFMAWAETVVPGAVPTLLHCDRERGLFAMEYLGAEWTTWKARLWAGDLSPEVAAQVGTVLGTLHRHAWGCEEVAARFDNTPLFRELRIAPYLLTSAQRHPDLAQVLEAEAARLERTRLTLVHGDYSPKNLMTDGQRVKVLDAEVAWFGDPAFDLAFLSTHLWLKSVKFPQRAHGYLELQKIFLQAYAQALGSHWDADLEHRAARLLPMLLVARVSGKSPAGYFSKGGPEEVFLLAYAGNQLRSPEGPRRFADLSTDLLQKLVL